MITGLWDTPVGERGYTFSGWHYTVVDSPGLPTPAQASHPPVIIGGAGKRRTTALAARYAAEFNAAFKSVDEIDSQLFTRVRAACTAAGRDSDTLALSVARGAVVGRNDAEVHGRLRCTAVTRRRCGPRVRRHPRRGRRQARRSRRRRADRAYLQLPDLTDLDHLDLIASEVLPHIT